MPAVDFLATNTRREYLIPYSETNPAITRHEAIDDTVGSPNDAADYLYKIPSGTNHATFTWANTIPAGSTINSVAVTCRVIHDPLESSVAQAAVLEVGGVTYFQYGLPGYSGWTTTTKTWLTNPAGGAWTYDALSTLYFGVLLTMADEWSTLTRCTQCYLTIDYTPPATTFCPHGCIC